MLTRPLTLIALLACTVMTANCAGLRPPSEAAPPRLPLPATADEPCHLTMLPAAPTSADLEAGYMGRGADVIACDAARQLAVDTLKAERALQDRWRAERPR